MSATESESQPSIAPVTELVRVLQELLRREAEVELAGGEQQNTNAELWRQTNLQAIDGIELAIASLQATELAEAVVQLLIAGGYADQVAEELDDPRLREPVSRLVRLLGSASPVVAEAAGVDLAAYAPDAMRRVSGIGPSLPAMPTARLPLDLPPGSRRACKSRGKPQFHAIELLR